MMKREHLKSMVCFIAASLLALSSLCGLAAGETRDLVEVGGVKVHGMGFDEDLYSQVDSITVQVSQDDNEYNAAVDYKNGNVNRDAAEGDFDGAVIDTSKALGVTVTVNWKDGTSSNVPVSKQSADGNGKKSTLNVWCGGVTKPTPSPSQTPTPSPSETPTPSPSETPTPSPSETPTPSPSETPTPSPSETPTPSPSETPTPSPSETPTPSPSETPIPTPTSTPFVIPSPNPSTTPVIPSVYEEIEDDDVPLDSPTEIIEDEEVPLAKTGDPIQNVSAIVFGLAALVAAVGLVLYKKEN
jgi:LPXTG-motif cell wall-anchored protein